MRRHGYLIDQRFGKDLWGIYKIQKNEKLQSCLPVQSHYFDWIDIFNSRI